MNLRFLKKRREENYRKYFDNEDDEKNDDLDTTIGTNISKKVKIY